MTNIKKLPHSQIEFEISISWEKWKKYLDEAAKEASEELKIPGFRPGFAPRNLVEQRIGKNIILANAAEKAIQKNYVDFVTREKIEVIGKPEIKLDKIEEEKELKYHVQVAVMPEIKVKDGYKKDIKKINEEFGKKDLKIEEKEIELELEKLAASRVKLVTVRREARNNDGVEIDFEVKMGGVPIENGSSRKHSLVLGKGVFIPGFEENLIGMKEGEQKDFELNFPEEYFKKDLAGKPASFHVKMNLVQERQTPEIDDEFAKSVGKFENLMELKKSITEGLEHEKKHKIQDEKRSEYVEKIIENSEVDLPEILILEESRKMMEEFEYQLAPMGMSLDQYLLKLGKKKEDLEKDWQPQAEKRVKIALALKEIAKMDNIEAESSEIESEMNKTLKHYKGVKDIEKNIDMERLYSFCKNTLENEKVFEMLEKLI